jgi:histidyl-tRNA synthetase
MINFSPPPGVEDIFPETISSWQFIERSVSSFFPLYGFNEIRTPIFEYTEVFSKCIGEQTEIVQKEMYTFEDRGGRSLTLRPEGTAGIIRALNSPGQSDSKRVYYIGPMFRGEKPAAGRKRQFHQVGVENICQPSPELDAECIIMLTKFLKRIGIEQWTLKINSRGDAADRLNAGNKLKEIFSRLKPQLCEDCGKRLDRNVWRILDCKNPQCAELSLSAGNIGEMFSDTSNQYLDRVLAFLKQEKIPFEKDVRLVRGLDYYAHTVFELTHGGLGAQNAIAGGGRYEITSPGSKEAVYGVGFACGMERLLMAASSENRTSISRAPVSVFLISLGESAKKLNLAVAENLRDNGISAVADFENKSLKSAMRLADKLKAPFVLIRGDNEISKNTVIIKKMSDGTQAEAPDNELMQYFAKFISEKI